MKKIYEGKTNKSNILVADKEDWANVLNTYFRPYQDPVAAEDLEIPGTTPAGEVTRDWGVVATSTTTIGGLLGNAQAQQ